jgi:hypothetical protein
MGVPVPPFGYQGSTEMMKVTVAVVGWILVIGTDGAVAPVLRPILVPAF